MSDRTQGSLSIRLATPDDAEGIRRVYAPYIATPITFEEDVPSPEDFYARMEEIMRSYPCLAACADGRVIGFAYAHRQAERAAYDWNVELSVYLDESEERRGIGSALYKTLMGLLSLQGIRCAYARVTLPNAASERLHARFGFDIMGIQRSAGYKNGAWRDVAWYAKPIAPFDDDPDRPIPFPAVLDDRVGEVEALLAAANRSVAR